MKYTDVSGSDRAPAKRRYESPRLVRLGSVRDLTHGGSPVHNGDGGLKKPNP